MLLYLLGILAAVLVGMAPIIAHAVIRSQMAASPLQQFAQLMVDYLVMPIAALLSLSPVLPYLALAFVAALAVYALWWYARQKMLTGRNKPQVIDLE